QAEPGAQPVVTGDGGVGFSGGQFLYLDDRQVSMNDFTMFMAYELDRDDANDQVLFSSPKLQMTLGGRDAGGRARSLHIQEDGRSLTGPVVRPGNHQQFSLASTSAGMLLRTPRQGAFASTSGDGQPLSTFTTIGALRALSANEARDHFRGKIREVLIYDRWLLNARNLALLEDYQLSRWQEFRAWNYRDNTLPVTIRGANGVRNVIAAGEADDSLIGGDR
ncbi:MAG: hypothetical protein GWO24_38175, partial [Akkermansiaceae bacterium]|nr:hypothetical protein [Akkermansiaceae bacterium]